MEFKFVAYLAECAVMVVVMTIAKDDASHHFPTPYEREAWRPIGVLDCSWCCCAAKLKKEKMGELQHRQWQKSANGCALPFFPFYHLPLPVAAMAIPPLQAYAPKWWLLLVTAVAAATGAEAITESTTTEAAADAAAEFSVVVWCCASGDAATATAATAAGSSKISAGGACAETVSPECTRVAPGCG